MSRTDPGIDGGPIIAIHCAAEEEGMDGGKTEQVSAAAQGARRGLKLIYSYLVSHVHRVYESQSLLSQSWSRYPPTSPSSSHEVLRQPHDKRTMVKIAVAGGSGQVAREVIDALLAAKRHDIIILSRKKPLTSNNALGISWETVDYNNKECLTMALKGVHTVLSFIQLLSDPDQIAQKNLIDAAVGAGVQRFAPSEYGSRCTVHMPWWQGKEVIREYLREVNREKEVLEYTLFQPGLFLDYLAFPHKTSKYLDPLQSVIDFQHKRAMVVAGHEDAIMTLTTVSDLAAIIARAVEYKDKWPTVSGIRGNWLTFAQLLEIGERIRGGPFAVDRLELRDLEAGILEASWALEAVHAAVSSSQAAEMLKTVSIGILLSSLKGAWESSDELNRLFPDYTFTSAEDFLVRVWQ
ncbi:hypothetical protein jhhlp_008563 [Lomentospora prolificans]|uniref:NmrA-like domain-containing protein n=1 Tax=Lomentospora prolificans TaxID=41688 RepID=A0A2N3MYE8_9PEZI|nr:hypothetical protein jhhlp_008563 [Lomentospora prolificans]